MNVNLIAVVLLIYALWGSAFAFFSKKGLRYSLADYFLANRKLHWLTASLSYGATTYSAFMMLGLAGLTYRGGVGALGFELIYLSGLVWAVLLGPRLLTLSKHYHCVSPAEILTIRYRNRWVGIAYTLSALFFLIPYSSAQLTGIGYLLETLSQGKIGYFSGLLIAVILSFLWVEIAGLRSVAVTDSLQAGIMMVSAVTLLLILINRFLGGWGGLFRTLEVTYPQWLAVPGTGFFRFHTFLGLSLPWFFFSISNPQVVQRLFVPQSLQEMRKTLTGFLFYGLLYTFITIMLGFSALCLVPGLSNPDLATPTILVRFPLPTWVVLFTALGVLSAAISTIDSILLTLSAMFARDILPPTIEETRKLRLTRLVLIPLLGVAIFVFALQRLNLIALLSVASSAGLIALVPSLIGAVFWKRGNSQGALASIIGGALTSLFLQLFNYKPMGLWPGVVTLLISTLLFVFFALLLPPTLHQEYLTLLFSKPKNSNPR